MCCLRGLRNDYILENYFEKIYVQEERTFMCI